MENVHRTGHNFKLTLQNESDNITEVHCCALKLEGRALVFHFFFPLGLLLPVILAKSEGSS